MVNALERWHRVQELCATLEALPATRHAEVLEAIEPNPGIRVDTLALLRAFREESRGRRPLSGRTAEPSTAVAPAFVSHYRIVEWLGSGGTGDVFRATRTVQGTEHEVALKKFSSRPGREYLSHFIKEQRIPCRRRACERRGVSGCRRRRRRPAVCRVRACGRHR
jgi:hypothetical protein